MAYGRKRKAVAKRFNAFRYRTKVPYKSNKRMRSAGTVRFALRGVKRLNQMIETKEGCWKVSSTNVAYQHNTVSQINLASASNNPLARQTTAQSDDPMGANLMHIIGDSCAIKGMKATFFIENSLGRPKVFYRIMLLKGPRGATFTDCFKGITGNIMIDQVNTEKYKIMAQNRFTCTPSNAQATNSVVLTGVPQDNGTAVGVASKIVNFWVPGRKFGRNGVIQYENGSSEVKFYDYKWVIAVYDWFGTPALNNVGQINEGYIKVYFKDA